MGIRDLVRPLEGATLLDPAGEWLSAKVGALLGSGPAKNMLSGTFMGHALHPVLTDVPIGALTAATVFDSSVATPAADHGRRAHRARTRCRSPPTALSGLSDWSDTVDAERRLGLIHALANAGSSALYLAALLSRRGGNRGIGPRLQHRRPRRARRQRLHRRPPRVRPRHGRRPHRLRRAPDGLDPRGAGGRPRRGHARRWCEASGYGVLLYSHAGTIRAIAARCTHAGGPLDEGEVDDDLCVTCPWHGSRFRLADGAVVRGPATAPQPAFDVQVGRRQRRGAPPPGLSRGRRHADRMTIRQVVTDPGRNAHANRLRSRQRL